MASRACVIKALLLLRTVIDFEIQQTKEHPELGLIPGTADVWCKDLSQYTDEQVESAAEHFRSTLPSTWNRKPRPGDIQAVIEEMEIGGWSNAWHEFQDRADRFRVNMAGNSGPWSSLLVKTAAHRCGGVGALQACKPENLQHFQSQFKKHYEELCRERKMQGVQSDAGRALLEPPQESSQKLLTGDMVIQLAYNREKLPEERRNTPEAKAKADEIIANLKRKQREQMGAMSGDLLKIEKPVYDIPRPGGSGLSSFKTVVNKMKEDSANA